MKRDFSCPGWTMEDCAGGGGDTYFVEGLMVSARRRVRRLISSALRLFICRG